MKRVYLALPSADVVAAAIRKRLKRKKLAKHLKIVDELESAQVVVTSSDDIGTLPERLPESVELLQLIDCGGGLRYRDAPNLTISNAFDLYESQIVLLMSLLVHESGRIRRDLGYGLLQLGLIGLGNVGTSFLSLLAGYTAKHIGDSSSQRPFHLGCIAVNDVRTPRKRTVDALRKKFSRSEVSVRQIPLDLLLSTSDVVAVAVHHGPSADPLLGESEARLMDPMAWVIDASEKGVVDRSAFTSLQQFRSWITDREYEVDIAYFGESNRMRSGPVYVPVVETVKTRLMELDVNIEQSPKSIARFICRNLRRFNRGKSINEVEHVDFESLVE